MNIAKEISQLIKNQLVIRHRTDKEQSGDASGCIICSRRLILPPGALCLAVNSEGLVCSICGEKYAPEMMTALRAQQPETVDDNNRFSKRVPQINPILSPTEWITIARDIEALAETSTELAKGIARGIVEAPAGHIGLMHYAKDIQKPPRREFESEKDYELRVRTYRMTRLYEKIFADTTGRVEKLKEYLQKIGLPSLSG